MTCLIRSHAHASVKSDTEERASAASTVLLNTNWSCSKYLVDFAPLEFELQILTLNRAYVSHQGAHEPICVSVCSWPFVSNCNMLKYRYPSFF